MSRPAAFLPGFLLTTLLTTMMAIQANAQVTIRDTVEIGQNAVMGKKDPLPPPAPVPVVEGLLCAYYDAAWRLAAPIPDTATVSVINNSVLFATDTVASRLPVTTTSSVVACGGTTTKYTQGPLISSVERYWAVGPVQQDDEIQVSYSRGTAPTVITQQPGYWTAEMGVTCQVHPQILYQEYVKLSFAVVEPDTSLTIAPSQSTVWPDKLDEGTPGTFSTSFSDPVVDEIAIRLFDGCAPIAQHEVSVRAEWVYGSGGHLHETSQDSAPFFGSMGTFTDLADTAHTGQATITATTGPDGYVRLSYRAPEFGGSVDIVATTVVGSDTLTNAHRIDVKVPSLVAIPDTIGDGLIGGTCNHHGPRDDSSYPNCRTPDDNHFVTQETLNRLGAIVSAWDPGHPNEPIKFNDGSLPNGGRFDECGEWSSCANHKFHRLGRDIDVRTQNAGFPSDSGILLEEMKDVSGNLVLYRGKTILYNQDLDRVVVANGGRPKPEVHFRNHYHFYFY